VSQTNRPAALATLIAIVGGVIGVVAAAGAPTWVLVLLIVVELLLAVAVGLTWKQARS
jgi:hypothetical protein